MTVYHNNELARGAYRHEVFFGGEAVLYLPIISDLFTDKSPSLPKIIALSRVRALYYFAIHDKI